MENPSRDVNFNTTKSISNWKVKVEMNFSQILLSLHKYWPKCEEIWKGGNSGQDLIVQFYLSTRIFEIGSKLLLATCEKEGWRLLMCWILGSMFKDWLMQSSRRKYLKQGNRSSILPSSRQPLYFTVVKKWDGDVILDSDHLEHVLQTDNTISYRASFG